MKKSIDEIIKEGDNLMVIAGDPEEVTKDFSKVDVLDKGYVRLVDCMGDDLSVVRSARVSYDAEPRNDGSDTKLINYLMRNGHTSPFEAVSFTFEIKLPIFIVRQWHRHRTWSYNEVSARYTKLPREFYIPEVGTIGVQSSHNKQMRDIVEMDKESIEEHQNLIEDYEAYCNGAFAMYDALSDAGWPRELARSVLPVSTYTKMFASVDLHNLFHFLRLRLHEHSQYEIREYGLAIEKLVKPIVPDSYAAFEEHILNRG